MKGFGIQANIPNSNSIIPQEVILKNNLKILKQQTVVDFAKYSTTKKKLNSLTKRSK